MNVKMKCDPAAYFNSICDTFWCCTKCQSYI